MNHRRRCEKFMDFYEEKFKNKKPQEINW